jgi:hypothetical protein
MSENRFRDGPTFADLTEEQRREQLRMLFCPRIATKREREPMKAPKGTQYNARHGTFRARYVLPQKQGADGPGGKAAARRLKQMQKQGKVTTEQLFVGDERGGYLPASAPMVFDEASEVTPEMWEGVTVFNPKQFVKEGRATGRAEIGASALGMRIDEVPDVEAQDATRNID